MLKKLTMISLVLSTAIAGINFAGTKPANASDCIGNCNTDSLLYICVKNTTQQDVILKGQNNHTNFMKESAKPGGSYWYWFRRPRNSNRNLTVFLNGQADDARYNWTGLTPSQLGRSQACFFNQWNIKETRNGDLYLQKES